MRLTENQLRRVIRRVLLETPQNPFQKIDYLEEWPNRGHFEISVDDVQYWADNLGIEADHPMNPQGKEIGTSGWNDTLAIYVDPREHGLTIRGGKTASGWIGIYGEALYWKGKWGASIVVEGGYSGKSDPLANPEDLRDPRNAPAWRDFFKNWARYANGDSKGSFESAGTW